MAKIKTLVTAYIVYEDGSPIDFVSFTEKANENVMFSEASRILDKAIKEIDLSSLLPIYRSVFIVEIGSVYERKVIAVGKTTESGEFKFEIAGMEEIF